MFFFYIHSKYDMLTKSNSVFRTIIFFEAGALPWSIIWLPWHMNIVINQYDTSSWDCIKMESLYHKLFSDWHLKNSAKKKKSTWGRDHSNPVLPPCILPMHCRPEHVSLIIEACLFGI